MDRPTDEYKNEPEQLGERETFENQQSAEQTPATPKYDYVFFAGFWIRFWAYIIDLIVVGSLNRLLIYPLLRWMDLPTDESGLFSIASILTAIVMYLYFILMTKKLGQTLGKMIFGLKVIQKDGNQLSWSAVVFREFIGKFISKTVLFIGFIMIAFMPKKQGLHDWFADTLVVQEKSGMLITHANIN